MRRCSSLVASRAILDVERERPKVPEARQSHALGKAPPVTLREPGCSPGRLQEPALQIPILGQQRRLGGANRQVANAGVSAPWTLIASALVGG
jgi:hypothetical protein